MRKLLVILVLCTISQAQQWSGILSPTRAIDWSSAGVAGGIPTNRTQCGSTLTSSSTLAQIQTAINNCPAGQFVKLGTGTFTLSGGLSMKSNVTLRGDGANLTKLNFTSGSTSCLLGQSAAICSSGGGNFTTNGDPAPFSTAAANKRAWTGTGGVNGAYTKGGTVLNLASSTSGLAVGDNLIVYQDDNALPPASTGYIIGENTSNTGPSFGFSREGSRGTGQQQIVRVTNIAGSAITITPGIYQDTFVASKNPRVAWFGSTMSGVGLEDFAILGNAVTRFSNIAFFNTADSWVKGVSSTETGSRDHVMIMASKNVTIRDGFFSLSCVGGCNGAATGYGLETWEATSYLIENNILLNVQSPFLFSAASAGGVVAYNYSPACAVGCGSGATGLASHEEGFILNLYEANDADHWRADTFHGSQVLDTGFRNKSPGGGEGAVDIWAYNRYWNIIGNILGNASSNNYLCASPDSAGRCGRFNPNIIRCGFAGANPGPGPEQGNNGQVLQDPFTCTSMMIWDNYDTVTGTVRTNCSEVPTGLASFANSCPASTALPASFYLSAKPAWWPVAKPWPNFGPDVTGGNIAGFAGHAYTLPANDCFTSVSGNIANFNAQTCFPLNNSNPVAQLLPVSPALFASTQIGFSNGPIVETYTNIGTSSLAITSISIPAGDFSQTNNCPATLTVSPAAGSSCAISITFTPTVTGSQTGTLTIVDNAAGSPRPISLSGTGNPNRIVGHTVGGGRIVH